MAGSLEAQLMAEVTSMSTHYMKERGSHLRKVAGLAILLVLLFLPNIPPTERSSSARARWLGLDYPGAFLSVAFVTTLLIPLQWGGNVRPWNDPVIIVLFVVVRTESPHAHISANTARYS